MSEQDRASTIGAAVIEHKEVSDQITALRIKADQIGNTYAQIGGGLKAYPEGVCPEKEGIDVRFSDHRVSVPREGFPTAADIFELTTKIRKALIRKFELEAQLADYQIR